MSERERLLREVRRYEGYLRECESYIAEESKWPEMQESFIYYLTSYHRAVKGLVIYLKEITNKTEDDRYLLDVYRRFVPYYGD